MSRRPARATLPALSCKIVELGFPAIIFDIRPDSSRPAEPRKIITMAKIAKTADRKKEMDTSKSTNCPKCGKPTRIVKRTKDRERGVPGGVYISCSGCEFFEKL